MLRGAGNPLAVETAPDSIAQPPCGAANHGEWIVALFQDHDGLGAPHLGGDVAQLVLTTSWTVQIGQTDGDAINAILVAVDSEFKTSLQLFLQFLVPLKTCSNDDFHLLPPIVVAFDDEECNRVATSRCCVMKVQAEPSCQQLPEKAQRWRFLGSYGMRTHDRKRVYEWNPE